jgi:hypothetical protein
MTISQKKRMVKKAFNELRDAKKVEANKRWQETFVEEMSEVQVGEYLSTLKRMARGRKKGVSPPMAKAELDAIAEHYEKQSMPCRNAGANRSPVQILPGEFYVEVDQGDAYHAPPINPENLFSIERVAKLVKGTSYGKAGGGDGISKERMGIKRGRCPIGDIEENPVVQALAYLFQLTILLGVCPLRWSESIVVPLYKNKGKRDDWA